MAMSTTRDQAMPGKQLATKRQKRKKIIFDLQAYCGYSSLRTFSRGSPALVPYVKNYVPTTATIMVVAPPRCGWIGDRAARA
jgi:hypothetical protein